MKSIWNELLTALAILFLIAFSYPAIDSNISPFTQRLLDLTQWIVWIAFALDLLLNFSSSRNKKLFILKHPLDIAAVILPFLRPLRLLRVISFGGLVLQKVAIGRQFTVTIKVILASIFISFISAVQMTISESKVEGSNIKNFGDGIWWSITTVTTVGYGDRYPTTFEGKLLAVLLMITGISLMGVITATVATWFIEMSRKELDRNKK